jgi:putative transposase
MVRAIASRPFCLVKQQCSLYVLTMKALDKPGWHSRGYHPHYEANTLVQHVVFRTHGSIPPRVMAQAAMLTANEKSKLLDYWLDQGSTGRLFANPDCAAIMEDCLRFFDHDRYDLQAWCVMPTHVHVFLVTHPDLRIGQCVHSWKQAATRSLKDCLNQAGPFFAKDYFDRFCRSLKQSEATIAYIEANPVKAGLCTTAEQWPWSSAFKRGQGWSPRLDRLPMFLT